MSERELFIINKRRVRYDDTNHRVDDSVPHLLFYGTYEAAAERTKAYNQEGWSNHVTELQIKLTSAKRDLRDVLRRSEAADLLDEDVRKQLGIGSFKQGIEWETRHVAGAEKNLETAMALGPEKWTPNESYEEYYEFENVDVSYGTNFYIDDDGRIIVQ